MSEKLSIVGKSYPLSDAYQKVTGDLRYATDISIPRMLYAKILRSPIAHAKISSIDTSKAEIFPGVVAVITYKDVPDEEWVSVVYNYKGPVLDKRIRFVTCHPKDTTERLFKAMRGLPKIHNHLHLPLQSGSEKILRAMKRGYGPGHYLGLVGALRRHIPDCNITTDIIVGFPGEGNADFEATYNMMKSIEFDSAYIFKYSPRPPAESSRLEDGVPAEIKKARHAGLLELQKEISRRKRALGKAEALPMA